MVIISPEFVGAIDDFNLVCHDLVDQMAPREVRVAELKEKCNRAQHIVKSFTPNGCFFFEDEKTETLKALGERSERAQDAIANM